MFCYARELWLSARAKVLAAYYSALLKPEGKLYIGGRLHLVHPHKIGIGTGVRLNEGVLLDGTGGLWVGNGVHISRGAMLLTGKLNGQHHESSAVAVRDGAWIASRVIICPGVTIGARSVIGAGAVVTRDVPSGEVWAGVPARRIK